MISDPNHSYTAASKDGVISRRCHLNILVKAAIGGMLLPVTEASAMFGLGGPSNYEDFLHELDLNYLRVDDILAAHDKSRGAVNNSLPPKSQWKNIEVALKTADLAAPHLGTRRVRIVSAYRSPAYNARCSGASSRSKHMQNLALDLRYDASPSRVVRVMKQLRSKGAFKGGIGRYRSFTHIDGRGYNVNW